MKKYRGAIAGFLIILLATTTNLLVPAGAHADTDADWAWPGMQFDVYKGGLWYVCSVGYPAWDDAGTRYFITAGHCFRDDDGRHYVHPDGTDLNVYSPSDHVHAVGFERIYPKPRNGWYTDVSLVQMYPGKKLYGEGWQHIPNAPSTADVGDAACLVARYNHAKPNCGKVTATGVELTINGYDSTTAATSASYCAHSGDSGGAVYNRTGALGIEITGDPDHNEPGTAGACRSSFVPIGHVLRFLRRFEPSLVIY
ncbi:Trypsin [Mycobacteroides abscessus subsp. bolletii]|uniref:trypsin-like serine protease n=1 Tax=Mycobacteroides abscessus TaxID=36809 RepID=UPI0009A6DD0C|nr:trypsin-like serine protease [Mycobacteroides abscessus]SKS13994.1 Trypsin [Mycobacteroides abscessus subsp. bolletii]SKS29549.1 Trypsin [Mycobacteroides abscessus subsp. bolletii]